jgi:hypothetical protein
MPHQLVELDAKALAWIIAFMDRYASAQAQLADTALMYKSLARTMFSWGRRSFQAPIPRLG